MTHELCRRGAVALVGAAASLSIAAGCGSVEPDMPPEARLGEQVLVGRRGDQHAQVAAFLGIPYAEPPVGAMRWQAPRPLDAPNGRRDATQFAAACVQDDYNINWYRRVGAAFGADAAQFANPPFSEDCLYLNVWTPGLGRDAQFPVMVWIHGGANRSGWPFEPNYRGENLAARGGVVVVSVAYRHGVFGFFGHPELHGETNFGLRDQIAALRWIREHIGSFAGDARNVTIFGESAGAANIGYLMASPEAQGLFRRAISQSGGYQMLERRNLEDVEAVGRALSDALPGRPDLEGLRRQDSASILAAANESLHKHDWGPAVDGIVVPAPVAAGNLLRVAPLDLLVGTNRDEWYMYVGEGAAELDAGIEALSPAARPALRQLAAAEPTPRLGHDRAVTFANMVCAGYLMADTVRQAGGKSWVYRFARVRPGPGGRQLRAYHGAEIPYVFDTHDDWLATDAADRRLSETIMDYWTHFARTGDPNAGGLPAWPAYDAADPRVLALGDEVVAQPAPNHALCLDLAGELYGAAP